jgi:amino acid adenylation domain-containing protein
MSEEQAYTVLDTLTQAVSEITSKFAQPVADLDLFGPRSRTKVMKWNENVPARVNRCAHDLIKERNMHRPNAPAICAWDGQFTYGELDAKASSLAVKLANNYNVGPEVFVPVYFEKSKWTTVALLGILKAGGAFVLVDPSHPLQRIKDICDDSNASVVVTSQAKAPFASKLGRRVLVIGDDQFDWEATLELPATAPTVAPNNPIYSVFTSGSTGKPKGAVMSHASWCTSAEANRIGLFLSNESRVLQFASYAFDISIADMLLTLLAGGCVCVPSDNDRQSDLVNAINTLQANWACLTPSVTRILDPATVSSIHTLVLCGEPIAPGDITKWKPHVHLLNLYGPAECAILTTLNRYVENENDPNNVGLPTSAVCWIASPEDYEKLVPVGTVGELLVESPIVGREYMGEPVKTAASFLEYPSWLQKMRGSATGRLYRTGDLLQYLEDGSMRYIGRKDTQVKLRGQRVELGEVEYHLREKFPGAHDVIAEVIKASDDDRPPVLMAFIHLNRDNTPSQDETDIFGAPDDFFKRAVVTTTSQLDGVLPVFMVPTIFIPLAQIPLTKTGKTDRRAVRIAASGLSREQIGFYTATNSVKRAPNTEAERQFQRLFAHVLDLQINDIGIGDHFFKLGGDSIVAMTLIPKAREAGYSIHMADVFNHPKLCDLAEASCQIKALKSAAVAPFALVKDKMDMQELIQFAAEQCQVPVDQIEDIYPCTPLQEGLVALVAKRPGHYIATFEYELAGTVNIERFKSAWSVTAAANTILRTRIIQSDTAGTLQVVVRDSIVWQTFDDEHAYEEHIKAMSMGMGEVLVDFALIQPLPDTQKPFKCYLTLHHSLYDGSSLPRLWSQAQAAYNGEVLSQQQFSRFIEYIVTTQGADTFWKSEFDGLNAPIFPALPSSRYIPDPSSSLEYTISAIDHKSTEYTASTAIRLAWAVVMSCYTDSEDVLYGLTVNGRSAPLQGIDEMTGPTFATFPVRTQVRQKDTVREALAAIQQKTVDMMPYQQYGMQNIRQLSREASTACSFQCQLAIQAPSSTDGNDLLVNARTKHEDYGAFANYAFVIVCHLPAKGERDMIVTASYDRTIIEPSEAARMVRQFEHVLQILPESQSLRLGELDLLSAEDRKQLAKWNPVVPPAYDACLHDLVLRHAIDHPTAPAISAWDGDMTFKELEVATSILSQQLQALGIRPGALVPLLFDKSKWVVVAMIAIHRIGAACVNIDPSHPKGRIQEIINHTQAEFILMSPKYESSMAFDNITLITVPVTGDQPPAEYFSAPPCSPSDTAFIIFTSGSTGKAKGIVMEHANLATSIRGYSSEAYLTQSTRGLHFASYAFDASIYEIFGVLLNGGCICIPSEFERLNDIAPFINKHNVDWALFTPSFLALLEPSSVPGLKTIVLGGEAISQENVNTWASKVTLVTAYGPAEATICAAGPLPETGWKQGTLGHITGGVGWITLPSDPTRLAPIGVPGELVLEGRIVTRGYIRDEERTAAVYHTNPTWLRPFRERSFDSRVYYSGDLAMYNTDGTIRYLGRRDTQVKLRGQRIELGEVEHHVRHSFPNVTDVVVEVVAPNGGPPTLIAFVANAQDSDGRPGNPLFQAPTAEFLGQVEAATRKLSGAVPSYMVPSVFIQLSEIPRTSSDKANRRMLRDEAASLTQDQIQAFSGSNHSKRKPETKQEKLLQSLWAQTFKVALDDIGADDDFFHNGGDSIAGMRLAGMARRHGLHLPVSYIFRYPILSEQANAMKTLAESDSTEKYRPGSLLGVNNIAAFFHSELSAQVPQYQSQDVEDILPTTELQSSLLLGNNVTYSRLHMSNTEVNSEQLEQACRALVRKHAILRTVFVTFRGMIIQAVLHNAIFQLAKIECIEENLWEFSEKLCRQYATSPVPFGSLHFQPYLVSRSKSDHMLIIRMTHAQYDGVSFPLLSRDLTSAYNGTHLQDTAPSFAHYLHYRLRHQTKSGEAHRFWREYLRNAEMTDNRAMCRTTGPGLLNEENEFLVKPLRDIPLPVAPEGITLATLVKAAWAVVVARAAGRRDVVFGHIVNGRDAPLQDVDTISGPCITISPFRVSMPEDENWTGLDLLRHVQTQYIRSMPYANMDFQDILANATSWSPDTDFGSVVTHQDGNIDLSGSLGSSPETSVTSSTSPDAAETTRTTISVTAGTEQWKTMDLGIQPHFHVVTYPVVNDDGEKRLLVQFAVSSHRVNPDDADYAIDEFCRVMTEVSEDPLRRLEL